MGLVTGASPLALLELALAEDLELLKKCLVSGEEPATVDRLVSALLPRLGLSPTLHDWLTPAPPNQQKLLLVQIGILCLETRPSADLVYALAQYANPETPWSNAELSHAVLSLLDSPCRGAYTKFLDELAQRTKADFLRTPAPLTTVASRRWHAGARFSKVKPTRLALSRAPSSADELARRQQWRTSPQAAALGTAYFWMTVDPGSATLAACASFTLNVLDDLDPLLRAQGCHLLRRLIAVDQGGFLPALGLVAVFEESLKVCLSYLPALTPPQVSLRLLRDGAYPALFALMALGAPYTAYLDVLTAHLMGSVTHVRGRANDAATNEVLAYLLAQTAWLVHNRLQCSVLVCLSRLDYMLAQIVTDLFLVDQPGGAAVIDEALAVQAAILLECAKEPGAAENLWQYRLDLLASWVVLGKRVAKFGVGSLLTALRLQRNMALLKELAALVGENFDDEVHRLTAAPGLAAVLGTQT